MKKILFIFLSLYSFCFSYDTSLDINGFDIPFDYVVSDNLSHHYEGQLYDVSYIGEPLYIVNLSNIGTYNGRKYIDGTSNVRCGYSHYACVASVTWSECPAGEHSINNHSECSSAPLCPDGFTENSDGICETGDGCHNDGSNDPSSGIPIGWYFYGSVSPGTCSSHVDNVQFTDSMEYALVCSPQTYCALELADGMCAPDEHKENNECVCNTGFEHVDGGTQCTDSCTLLTVPATYNGLNYIGSFDTISALNSYVSAHSIANAHPYNSTIFDLTSKCIKIHLFGNDTSCDGFNPPLTDDNSYPYQLSFENQNDCYTYFSDNMIMNGSCHTYSGCFKSFAYFPDMNDTVPDDNNDTNSTNPPPDDNNDTNSTNPPPDDNNDTNNTNLPPSGSDVGDVIKAINNNTNMNKKELDDLLNWQKSLTNEEKSFHTWYKDRFGNWVPQQINAQKETTSAVKETTNAVKETTNAVNSASDAITTKQQLAIDELKKLTNTDYTVPDEVTADDVNYSVDLSFLDTLLSSFSDSYDNLKDDLSTVKTQSDDLISIFQTNKDGGFSLNLPHATVTTCPYSVSFDYSSDKSVDFDIDICKITAPLYPTFYALFSLIFSIFIVVFSYKAILRLIL